MLFFALDVDFELLAAFLVPDELLDFDMSPSFEVNKGGSLGRDSPPRDCCGRVARRLALHGKQRLSGSKNTLATEGAVDATG